jgi:integrase/recombinase XerD
MLMTAVDTYVAVRRATGFQFKAGEASLRSFACFATARGDRHVVTSTALAWATIASSEAQRHNRLQTIVRFARFLHAEDPQHEIPPAQVFCGRRQRPTPYIFSAEELQRLVTHARQLGPVGSLRPYTYSTLFGLLAATGMRPAEARTLQLSDITPEGLTIRESKFQKSRLLPLHETTWVALRNYVERRRRVAGHNTHVFVSCRGRRLSHTVVAETFHAVVKAAGLPDAPGKPRPRLMDLRHTFAVRGLQMCPNAREHVGRQVLALTTYMGHAKVASTYWYLESTPELLADIAQRCEAFVTGGDQCP